jgi:CheY-like chemotaxis protein
MDIRTGSSNTRPRKPKILLADDHTPILDWASKLLANDFEVVATVTDGRQALNAARRLEPDVVVLDITMPDLDGFQTAQELKQAGSCATVVFLTMHQEDEYVTEAIRCGAKAYVLKTRARWDLPSAIYHALAGRQFLPSLAPLAITAGGSHVAQFHANDDRSWLDEAAGFLSTALRRGDAVAVVLTESNREVIGFRMKKRGWDVGELERQGRYLAFDAAESLTQVMRNGQPDADSLAEIVHGLERARLASARSPHSRLALIGEIAVPLCRSGNLEAVLQLEQLWNDLTRPLPFLTVCAYPIECFDRKVAPGLLPGVCVQHSVISHATERAI